MDGGAAARIAALTAEGSSIDEPLRILEIGAGTGQLTTALLAQTQSVTAIEFDPELIAILRSRKELAEAAIIEADALSFDYAQFAQSGPWRVAGNLPYNIATPLMMGLIEMDGGPQVLVIMIQKDVAARLIAQPSTPAYGSLSIAVQYAMQVERVFTLKPSAFYPQPKVDSTVVRLTRRSQPAVEVADSKRFLQVARAAFAYRRKTLANSLSLALGLQRGDVAEALLTIGLNPEIRGEQLSLSDFARLTDRLAG
ncbi:MAG: 16S rRNA (adenine(1518)-N(6)/adenine(1519)-N(6))-dimethyltransferase RsmA [Candidatus Eremiobacteraeota bacterium]|nr:16S rRNA (adenine(1518)-N(6)/adenine(1519)-N(6))-dimethyltransferase RsmA [Candidatus Eremiobacteraeota bacterium]